MPELKTKQEAADALRCSLRTVDGLIASGKLRVIRLGGGRLVRIEPAELERFIAESKAQSAA
jgi:excisionase family DNA binding protein